MRLPCVWWHVTHMSVIPAQLAALQGSQWLRSLTQIVWTEIAGQSSELVRSAKSPLRTVVISSCRTFLCRLLINSRYPMPHANCPFLGLNTVMVAQNTRRCTQTTHHLKIRSASTYTPCVQSL